MVKKVTFFTGVTARRLSGFILVWLIILFLFAFLYIQARRVVINEIRNQALGVAIATAAGIDAQNLEQVRSLEDATKPGYLAVQTMLLRILETNPDVRYLYTMRRALRETAEPTDYEFIVDAPARDVNLDGVINSDEICEPPGQLYHAANLPEMYNAWYRAGADASVSPDPPYPDLMSGYAPIKNSSGQTVAIVGVDITAQTVRTKLITLRVVMLVVWILLSLLITLGVQLYYQQQEALEQIKELSDELTKRNDLLRAANAELAEHNERYEKELKLARTLQLHEIPKTFPRQDRIRFDEYYLTCDMPGGDFFNVFALDHDHIALYMADASGHGMTSALVSGLFHPTFNAMQKMETPATSRFYADLWNPAEVLSTLNNMLIKEIPEYEFVTMIYAVIDLQTQEYTLARAGHPTPVHFDVKARHAGVWDVPAGAALGLITDRTYTTTRKSIRQGDKVVFYTDGLPGALNSTGDTFGEEKIRMIVEENGTKDSRNIIATLRQAVEQHRGDSTVNDDFSLLVVEMKAGESEK
ncbi:MAG: PP2C family protein-serine/threonine phosphatase [Lentisphaerota bacterium]